MNNLEDNCKTGEYDMNKVKSSNKSEIKRAKLLRRMKKNQLYKNILASHVRISKLFVTDRELVQMRRPFTPVD